MLRNGTPLSDREIREVSLLGLLCVINNILKNILVVNTAARVLELFPMEPLILINGSTSSNTSSKASGWMVEEIILV